MSDGAHPLSNAELDAKIIELDRAADPRPPAFTDEALALHFAERHAGDLRYVAAWSRWLIWRDTYWQFENTLRAFDLARAVCRKAAAECNKAKVAAALASAKTVAAVITLARADRGLAATVDQWDADPWLLNTPGGVVDLRTGMIRVGRQDDYMTRITAAAPDADCRMPTWLNFLDRVTDGNAELTAYLKRMGEPAEGPHGHRQICAASGHAGP